MNVKIVLSCTAALAGLSFVASMHAETDAVRVADRLSDAVPSVAVVDGPTTAAVGGIGPDVICSRAGNSNTSGPNENSSVTHWGDADGIAGYSLGTTSCNIGDEVHPWVSGSSAQHPVIAQNFYRLENGRFEQVGMSWLKHSFCAVSEPTCGDCQPNAGCSELGVGCADTYSAGLNGNQGNLGPRSNVNPTTATHTHPHPAPVGENATRGRLQVQIDDIDPALHPTATWILEGQYVAQQDAEAGNHFNNVSWREFEVGVDHTDVTAIGSTTQEKPAINAWTGAAIEQLIVDGRFNLGHMATDNGDGTWHYEYALYNMNSDRAANSFSIPVPECATLTNIEFHDVDYHSGDGEAAPGENYDGTDWAVDRSAGMLTWSTDDFGSNANANALRWGTLYNFRFDADLPPTTTKAVMGVFKPGTPTSVEANAVAPETPSPILCPLDCDYTNSPGACPDSQVGVADLLAVLAQWGTSAGCDLNDSGEVDVEDLLSVLGAWGGCF